MKKKYKAEDIAQFCPRYLSNERREYLKRQEAIAKEQKRLEDIKKKEEQAKFN